MSNEVSFHAPIEVMAFILAHLPVIILMRYRCVSKAFRDLIDSRFFANMHLHYSMRNRSNRNILCRSLDPDLNPDLNCTSVGLYCVDIDTLSYFVPKCPRGHYNSSTILIGTCNGIVLLCDKYYKEITFWNPAIRRYVDVILPCFPQGSSYNYTYNLGFGYDHVNDDYKVVMWVHWYAVSKRPENDKELYVYSLKSNSWKRIVDLPYSVDSRGCHATYANGALNWICAEETVDSNSRNFIVAFDLATEEFGVLPALPVYDDTSYEVDITIGSMEGSLFVHCYLCDPGSLEESAEMVDTWLLVKRDGEVDTWTKLVSIKMPATFYKPLTYSKGGDHLLLGSEVKFLWYDLVKEEVREKFKIRGLPHYYETDVYVESLVHLDSGASDEENQLKQEKKVADDEGLELLSSMAMKILEEE